MSDNELLQQIANNTETMATLIRITLEQQIAAVVVLIWSIFWSTRES